MEQTYQQCADNCAKRNLIKSNETNDESESHRKEFLNCANNCESTFVSNITDRATKHAMKIITRDTKRFFLQNNPESIKLYFDAKANQVVPHF